MEIHFGGLTGRVPPAAILLIDPLGGRSGVDVKKGILVREHTDTGGFEIGGMEPWLRSAVGGINDILAGVYGFRLTGTDNGDFYLVINATGGRNSNIDLLVRIDGWIRTGDVYRYSLVNTEDRLEFRFETFRFSGFRFPLGPGDSKVFLLREKITVQYGIEDSRGKSVPDVLAKLLVRPVGGASEEKLIASPSGKDRVRYDPTTRLYSFELSTETLSAGQWELVLILMDGSRHTVPFELVSDSQSMPCG
ncbi:MAG: hypothetical protein Kow00128_02920 [Deltaproteobacteria bacterium]